MKKQYDELLQELFKGTIPRLRQHLATLKETERQTLFNDFKDILEAIRYACQERDVQVPYAIHEMYIDLKDDPESYLPSRWLNLKDQTSLFPAKGGGLFFIRLQCLLAGIGDKKSTYLALQRGTNYPAPPPDKQEDVNFPLSVGRVLLDRNPPWLKDLFLEFFDKMGEWIIRYEGTARLMAEILIKHPDWQQEFYEEMGRVMLLDGFHYPKFETLFESPMILAGLDYVLETEQHSIYTMPILNPTVRSKVTKLLLAGRMPREPLIELTLKKLRQSYAPGLAKGWLNMYQTLMLTPEETQSHAQAFLELLNAPVPAAARIANKMMTHLMDRNLLNETTVLPHMGQALLHPNQDIAKSNLALLKKTVMNNPKLESQAMGYAIEGLKTPHRTFRKELLKWLETISPEAMKKYDLKLLKSITEEEDLNAQDKKAIEKLIKRLENS